MPMMKNSIFEDVMSVHSAQLLNENIPHFYLIFVKLEFASIACVFLVVNSYTREFVVERYRGLIVKCNTLPAVLCVPAATLIEY